MSITEPRAKTRNLRRDPRASYMVTTPNLRGYAVGEGTASSPRPPLIRTTPTVDALMDVYRTIAGEHPDWDEYRAAMVADQRVVLTLRFDHIYGAILPG